MQSRPLKIIIFTALLFLPIFNFTSPSFAVETEKNTQKWTCPMHPHYIADDAGPCPICGMDLVKLNTNADRDNIEAQKKAATKIYVPPHTIQTMGVRFAKVEMASFGRQIRSYGIVQENERLRTQLSARVEGWVEKINVTAVGDQVNAGDTLFELYSPELIVSQRDYLSALRQSASQQSRITQRLFSFGVEPKALDLLKKKGQILQTVPFYAPQTGTIAQLNITQGSYVKRGMPIARIQDYSKVWVIVNPSEKDMVFLNKDTPATIYFPNLPGKVLNTKIDYIYPKIDTKTRTGQVRLVIDNKDGKLRPGSYADVIFETAITQRLSVPTSSILKQGGQDHVVISMGDGAFASRKVSLGLSAGDRTEVTKGLAVNETIVVSGQFLFDSESALRESFLKLERLQQPLSQIQLDKVQFASFDHIVDGALYLHEQLYKGGDITPSFFDPALAVKPYLWPQFKNTKLASILTNSQSALKQAQAAKTKSQSRAALQMLIAALEPWMLYANPDHYKALKLVFYESKKTKQRWVQLSSPPQNPFNTEEATPLPWPQMPVITKAKQADPEKANHRGNPHRGSHGN